MKARTFIGDESNVEVEIVAWMSSRLVRVRYEGRDYVRHVDRLTPVDDEARHWLGRVGEETR